MGRGEGENRLRRASDSIARVFSTRFAFCFLRAVSTTVTLIPRARDRKTSPAWRFGILYPASPPPQSPVLSHSLYPPVPPYREIVHADNSRRTCCENHFRVWRIHQPPIPISRARASIFRALACPIDPLRSVALSLSLCGEAKPRLGCD